jgi:hypothetical protein
MISYGFFLPVEDFIKIRAKNSNLSIRGYLLKELKEDPGFEVKYDKWDEFDKDPIKYWKENKHGRFFGQDSPLDINIRKTQEREIVCFVGENFYINLGQDIHCLEDVIRKEHIDFLVEEAGFMGYECKVYIQNPGKHSINLKEKDIQRKILVKL